MRHSALRTARGGGEEIRQRAGIELNLTVTARIQQLQATHVEAPVQARQQLQGERGEYLFATLDLAAEDLDLRARRIA